jgi:hypothetical protein
MEDDIRKPVVYLDLYEDAGKERLLKRLTGQSPDEASSLEERFAFWMDLVDR